MKKRHSSIDGFIPRRSGDQLGNLYNNVKNDAPIRSFEEKPLTAIGDDKMRNLGQPRAGYGMGRFDVEVSLNGVDDINEPVKKLSRHQRRRLEKQAAKRPRSLIRRVIKWFIILVLLAGLSIGGYTAYKFVAAGHNIFEGSILDIFKNQPLKQDNNGRSNILVLGTSEDDPGHEGANLTDSILVISIDQNNKTAYMFSVPRDLYVEYKEGCDAGYSGKINAYFSNCADTGNTSAAEQNRLTKTQKLVGDIFGLDIQYGVHVNQTVIKQAVDAVGGVDVNVQGSNGDPGVYDRNADWRCDFKCYYVKYDNGVHHLDGQHALFLAMARGDEAPTYGLGNSNFDREANQQKILIALRNKALSTGTLTNLSAITKLIDSLGDNLRTNIKTSEISTIMQIANEINTSDIKTISLIGDEQRVVKTGDVGGVSSVVPSAGIYDYGEIQALINKNLTNNPVLREAAPVVVLNGTDQVGLGQIEANKLTSAGFNVTLISNAPKNTYTTTEIYQIGEDNIATASKLSDLFDVTIKTTSPPITINGDVHFVVIIGVATS